MFNLYCNFYKTKYFYTFAEVMNYLNEATIAPATQLTDDEMENFFTSTQFARISSGNPATLKNYLSDLFTLVYERFYDHFAFESEHSELRDATEEITKLQVNMVSIITQTYERYSTLLGLYASEKSKLLDGITTTTQGVGQFNDTPQNIQTSVDNYTGDSHITNISKSSAVATSDADTKIARLDEITRKYRNLLKDWSDEFEQIFIERGNV